MVPKRCKAAVSCWIVQLDEGGRHCQGRVASRTVACARLNFLTDKGGVAPCLVAVVFHDVQRWHAYGNKMLNEPHDLDHLVGPRKKRRDRRCCLRDT
jgi:hypothetical protein